MDHLDYRKPVTVRFGMESCPFQIAEGFCVVDLVFNEKLIAVLGYSPFNVRALRNSRVLDYLEDLIPGESLTLEVGQNTKAALPGPKLHRCERYRRAKGIQLETSKGDHFKWVIDGKAVTVNYCNGELDVRSLKEVASKLKVKPRDLIIEILSS